MKNKTALPLVCLLAMVFTLVAPAKAGVVWLSSLDLSPITQGWGQPQADKSVTGAPMAIAGRKFDHGLGTHADSLARVDLHGEAQRFTAWVGVDDDAGQSPTGIIFKVIGDNKTLFRSQRMRLGSAAEKVDVDLTGVKKMILQADAVSENIGFAHADWAGAQIEYSGASPAIVGSPREPEYILTPPPPLRPRINGPGVYGVHPGHPFLYTIPATGERPMSFAVRGLPKGLVVDKETGQITGRLEKAGEYRVTLQAKNKHGRDTKKFRIVCGETLALTPYMGWNSWYVWESHVSDKIMRDAADAMVSAGLIDHGYQYVNIDDCWAVKPGSDDPILGGPARDDSGKILANKRFPDMKAMTDYIHAKGLKAGIYTSPGPTTCAGYEGAFGHEELDAERFAEWGFDFLKYDWCSYGRIAKNPSIEQLQKPYRLMAGCLHRQDRDIIFNFCQYGMGEVWKWGKDAGGNSWRTAGDLGGSFSGIPAALFRDGFDLYSRDHLDQFGGPGGWNDPDYLLLGYLSTWNGKTAPTPLTPNEQYTHVSLWCMVAAPLILSGDITRLDAFTLNLLCNDEVLAVDQDSLGKPGHRVAIDDTTEVWARDLDDGSKAVGLFNRGESDANVTAHWPDVGVSGRQLVRDLWRQKDLGRFKNEFTASVPRHGVVLVKFTPK